MAGNLYSGIFLTWYLTLYCHFNYGGEAWRENMLHAATGKSNGRRVGLRRIEALTKEAGVGRRLAGTTCFLERAEIRR